MKTGSKWQLFIPAELAYGESGPPSIGPSQTLIFDVELLSIKPPEPAATVAPGAAAPGASTTPAAKPSPATSAAPTAPAKPSPSTSAKPK